MLCDLTIKCKKHEHEKKGHCCSTIKPAVEAVTEPNQHQCGLAYPDPSPQSCVSAEEWSGCWRGKNTHACLYFFKSITIVSGGAKPKMQRWQSSEVVVVSGSNQDYKNGKVKRGRRPMADPYPRCTRAEPDTSVKVRLDAGAAVLHVTPRLLLERRHAT